MKMNKRLPNKRIVIILCIIFVLASLILFAVARYLLDGVRVRLLCDTDHQVLLEACNELSRQVAQGKLKPGKYDILFSSDPEVSKFPREILELRPRYIYIDENDYGRITIEMTGGLDIHFGVYAYTEDFKTPYKSFKYGDKELIPRLWYYDDGYENNPEYDKTIEALIQKRKLSN
jgi:hypothetical protein